MRDLKELKTLCELTKDHFTKLTFEASVTTGFEQTAREELFEKFGKKSKVCTSRGRVFFNTKYDEYHMYELLRSVDRINVLAGFTTISLKGKAEFKSLDLENIQKTVNVFHWEKVLAIWQEVEGFIGNIFPTKKEHEESLSLEKNVSEVKVKKESNDKWNDDIEFKSKNLHFEKTDLEKALDSVVSDSEDNDDDKENNNDENSILGTNNLWKKIPRFRVTCNRVGQNHSFASPEAATAFGGYLQDKFNWIVDLSNYDIEIILEINNEDVYAGVALNKKSNHFRNIKHFGPTTLRATVCYNMLRLCELKPGDIVIDPMCGGGSIPIEGSISFPSVYFIGGDEHEKAVIRTKSNINALNNNLKIDSLKWDATHLPLRTNSIDVFVSDFPFGKRCGSKFNNKALYKRALNELARVLRLKTGRCIILTWDKTSFDLAFQQTKLFWKQKKHLYINIGGLIASCFVLYRTQEEFYLKLSRKEKKLLAQKQWIKEKECKSLKGKIVFFPIKVV